MAPQISHRKPLQTLVLKLIYTSSNPTVASIIENKVRVNRVGTSVITATQAGNATYSAATANATLTVTKADQNHLIPTNS